MPGGNGCTVDMALCPECVQHVRYCAGKTEVACPFCEASFSPEALAGTAPSAGSVPRGLKQGVLAASFVGATLMAGTSFGCVAVAEYAAPVPENGWEQEQDAGQDADVGDESDVNDESDANDESDSDGDE